MGKTVARKLSAQVAAFAKAVLAKRSDADKLLNRATHEERRAFNFSNSKAMLRAAIEERAAAARRTGAAQARGGRWARSEAELEHEARVRQEVERLRRERPDMKMRAIERWIEKNMGVGRHRLHRILDAVPLAPSDRDE